VLNDEVELLLWHQANNQRQSCEEGTLRIIVPGIASKELSALKTRLVKNVCSWKVAILPARPRLSKDSTDSFFVFYWYRKKNGSVNYN